VDYCKRKSTCIPAPKSIFYNIAFAFDMIRLLMEEAPSGSFI
jgi:hypothetical protein